MILSLLCVALQPQEQRIKRNLAAGAVAQVLMHRDPRFQRQREVSGPDALEFPGAFGQCDVADTDTGELSRALIACKPRSD